MSFAIYTNMRFLFRSLLLLWGSVLCLTDGPRISAILTGQSQSFSLFLAVAWVSMMVSILLRFFPSRTESMGAQREHGENYRPRASVDREKLAAAIRRSNRDALKALAFWLALNALVGWLYVARKISAAILLLISLFYNLADLICIKFFCPFQRWIMSNRCCTTCRIYNWDHMMIHTPALLIPHPAAIPLWLGSALLALRWEWRWYRYPERFLELTNESLACAACRHPGSCQSCVKKKKKAT